LSRQGRVPPPTRQSPAGLSVTGRPSPPAAPGLRSLAAVDGYLVFLLLGLGTGAVYAALGLGLVLVHRASGVVNFAHGAMAMLVTYAFVEFRPEIGLWPALAVSVVVAAALGLVVDRLVFRPLRDAPALARVVASVGLLATLQALAVLWFGADSRPVPSLLPNRPIEVLGVDVPRDRLLLALLVIAAAAGLWALYRFTRFGLASRATAEDQTAVAMLGWSPDTLSTVNWMLASVLAGLGGILVGPLTALDPATTTLLVVPALAAALAGRLASFGTTVAVALALGMAQSAILPLQDDWSWIPRAGVREALPLVVMLAALALGAGRGLGRGGPVEQPLPLATRTRRPGRWTVVVVAGAALALPLLGGEYRLGLVNSLIGAVICLSLVVLTGYVGQISLAQMAFAGVAGFSLAKMATAWDVPFPVAPLAAALAAAAVGVAVGLPALRLRGLSLAVVTLAAAVTVEEAVFKAPALTGGFEGTRVPELPGLERAGTVGFGLAALAVLVAVALSVAALRRGRLGRRFLAVRANERAAAACGIGLTTTKLTAFALSAFIAGLGGALLGYGQGRLSFGSFGVFVSLSFLAAAYLGGIATVAGALVGGLLVPSGLVFTVISGQYQLLLSGLGLIVVAILRPQGIVGRRRSHRTGDGSTGQGRLKRHQFETKAP
jgi:branched-chain amino acid transport system permease protein